MRPLGSGNETLGSEYKIACAQMTKCYFGDRKYISMYFFVVSLQRYEPVVGSGNLQVNSSLLAEMSTFCSQVDWEESVSTCWCCISSSVDVCS